MPPFVAPAQVGAMQATVTGQDHQGRVFVKVNGVVKAAVPLDGSAWPAAATGTASTGAAHTHGPGHALAVGDQVLVIALGSNADRLFILGRIPL